MWYNNLVRWLLNSPLHFLVSKGLMLITYRGRRSGAEYTIPISYQRDGDTFTTMSLRERTWWRNLRGGVPVTVRVQGENLAATADVIEDEERVAEELMTYFTQAPGIARRLEMTTDPNGRPNREKIAEAAKSRVIVKTTLADES